MRNKNLILLLALLISSTFLFGCGDNEKEARGLLNEAQLLKGDKEESARRYKLLSEVVSKYPETTAATEAIPILNIYHAQLREVVSMALDTFRLDTGRYPTNEEGLEALVYWFDSLKVWDGPYARDKEYKTFMSFFDYKQDGETYQLILKQATKE
jgi:hypothetical protein